MAKGDVYGGFDWQQLAAMLNQWAADYLLNEGALTGWLPTTDDAGNVTKTPTLQREEFESDQAYQNALLLYQQGVHEETIRQFNIQHKLDQNRFDLDKLVAEAQIDINKGRLELDKLLGIGQLELGRGGLGMDYLNLLGSLKGPEDWVQYANVQRAAEQTDVPAWARMLVEGVTPAAFQGASGQATPASIPGMLQPTTLTTPSAPATGGLAAGGVDTGFLPGAPNPLGGLTAGNLNLGMQGAVNPFLAQANHDAGVQIGASQQQAAPVGQSLQQQAAASMPQWMAPLMQGHSVRSDQYQNLQPFERAMLAGAVNANGGNFDDWLYQLQQAAPKGQATGQSHWGGW